MSNGSARTLGRCAVASSMKPTRSAAVKSDLLLRTEALTTATTSSSKISAARVMTSRCPFVIGSYEPGQTAMCGRLGSGGMDADEGVPVAAFVGCGDLELERRAAVGFGDHERPRCQHRGKQFRE